MLREGERPNHVVNDQRVKYNGNSGDLDESSMPLTNDLSIVLYVAKPDPQP